MAESWVDTYEAGIAEWDGPSGMRSGWAGKRSAKRGAERPHPW